MYTWQYNAVLFKRKFVFLCFYVVDLLFVFVKILVVAIDLDQVIEIIKIQQILLVYCAKLAVFVLQVSDDFVFELETVWISFHWFLCLICLICCSCFLASLAVVAFLLFVDCFSSCLRSVV